MGFQILWIVYTNLDKKNNWDPKKISPKLEKTLWDFGFWVCLGLFEKCFDDDGGVWYIKRKEMPDSCGHLHISDDKAVKYAEENFGGFTF